MWVGLKNSDDQGTPFMSGSSPEARSPVAAGLQRCMTGVTRNPILARESNTPFDPFGPITYVSGDVLSLRVSTRIGTNPDDTKCAGPGGSLIIAVGLRLYYDAVTRASFDATLTPTRTKPVSPLDAPCGGSESGGVTTRTLDDTAPGAADAKCKDSASLHFAGGNPFAEIGTWSLVPVP